MKRKIFLSFAIAFLLFFCAGSIFALEINYPQLPSTEFPEKVGFVYYIKYIFNLAVWAAGLLAFGVLVWGGISYLTSVGSPERISKAKSRIKAAFLGSAILIGSYLIINTINPELLTLRAPALEEPAEEERTEHPVSFRPPLVRIKLLAKNTKEDSTRLKTESSNLPSFLEQCACDVGKAQCDCVGLDCVSVRCYGDPCPNREEIKGQQKKIKKLADQILYYRNLLSSERENMEPELELAIRRELLTETQVENLKADLEELVPAMEQIAVAAESLVAKTSSHLPLPENCTPECYNAYNDDCHDGCCPPVGCHNAAGCNVGECTSAEPGQTVYYPQAANLLNSIEGELDEISLLCDEIISMLSS